MPPTGNLSPNAPRDQPVDEIGKARAEEYQVAIAPYVETGRKTYPGAKQRFIAGLPTGTNLFALTNLRDNSGTWEQVFVALASIKDGEAYSFPEGELLDWVITHPDGTEEGNVVGKFLDEWQKTHPR